MKVTLLHNGDRTHTGWKTCEWAVERFDGLEMLDEPVDLPMSIIDKVDKIDRNMDRQTVILKRDGRVIHLPNVTITRVE